MPVLDLSEFNIVLAVVGAFLILFGIISSKIKHSWYLGEALPATLVGILFGPIGAKFIDSARWGAAEPDQQHEITLGVCRVVIGIQLAIVGFQLPAKYQLVRWKEKLIGMLPVMTTMWLTTSVCFYMIIPNLSWLAALVLGSCVACTDPVLSQAIAKGPFAEKYVPIHLRDIMSSESGANDSFSFPSLMLATFLIRHAATPGSGEANTIKEGALVARAEDVGRIGGGVGVALKMWFLETWLYTVLLSIVYGAVVGYASSLALKFAIKRRWIDSENFLLFPTAIGLFTLGTAGAINTEDLLACFAAGNALNWNGIYQEECNNRRDWVNPTICSLLNYGAFIYVGSVMPWNEFNAPDVTGITFPRLFALGFAVLAFRRIPAAMLSYKLLPKVCTNAREALVLGHFGPIGIGAIFFAEHTRTLFPELGDGDAEETHLIAALTPTVYWLVLFSIVFHGLSVPLLAFAYKRMNVPPVQECAIEILPFPSTAPFPRDSKVFERREESVIVEEKKVRNFSWGGSERTASFDDDKRSLDLSDVKQEVREMV
ncbi:plasma membrane antiporter [Macrophomina phaseolina]|uniref:Plasma membrane antiporter n=1 Tax=Macrophomina phaseolina TaxID=35725 RepID=A0ABQ8GBB9_9PEZI|nr:plasma membrane antiporter [Macrophomina phaseolina]